MKRDMDLCREILRQIAAHPDLNASVEIKVEGRSPDDISYQLYLLRDGGLIEGTGSDLQGLAYKPLRLTWKGSEFLAVAQDNTIWQQAKGAGGEGRG
jgi:Hypothetical protein (DUF2513)